MLLSLLRGLEFFAGEIFGAPLPHDWGGRMQAVWTWGWGVVMMAIIFLVSAVLLLGGIIGLRWLSDQSRPRAADAEGARDRKKESSAPRLNPMARKSRSAR